MEQEDSRIRSELADALRLDGINCRGYGIVPKYVMLDKDLTIESKAIYAYFCSYSGAGNCAFPGRDKILADLCMSKDAYYRHYNLLLTNGYITVEQVRNTGSRFVRNIYTLVSRPEKLGEPQANPRTEQARQQVIVAGLKSAGYGQIPKAVMTDRRLSVKSKGLYAYYAAFTGSGESAFPEKKTVLNQLRIGIHVYEKINKELQALNYVSIVQRHVNGRLGVNEVFLNEKPDELQGTTSHIIRKTEEKQCAGKQDTVFGDFVEAGIFLGDRKQDTEEQDIQRQDAVNPDTKRKQSEKEQKEKINNPKKEEDLLRKFREEQEALRKLTAAEAKKYTAEQTALQDRMILEMLASRSLSETVLQSRANIRAAIEILTDDAGLGSKKAYLNIPGGENAHAIFCLYRDTLIDLLAAKRSVRIGDRALTPGEVREKLEQKLRIDPEEGRIDLSDLYDRVFAGYAQAEQENRITVPKQYMKACILNCL